jgi:predicted MFS family arabinose efflux permease
VLTLATFAAVTAETLPVGLLPVIARDLGTSETRVGLLVSAYAVVVATASLPLTALLGRWSRRRALTALLLAYAVGNAVFSATGDYLWPWPPACWPAWRTPASSRSRSAPR